MRSTLLSNELHAKVKLFILALLLASLEIFIPRIPLLPWLKPGLANIVTIVWLFRYGIRDALLFGLLRIWVLGFFWGLSFFSMTLALSGLLLSVVIMGGAMFFVRKGVLGFWSVGVLGALSHNIGQLLMVSPLMGQLFSFEKQIPIMIPVAVLFGSLTAWGATQLLHVYHWPKQGLSNLVQRSKGTIANRNKGTLIAVVLLGIAVSLFAVSSFIVILIVACGLYFWAAIVTKSVVSPMIPLKRGWIFVLFIYLSFIPWVSSENQSLALFQALRISTWLICTTLFKVYHLDYLFFRMLKYIFKNSAETLDASLIVAEIFPSLLDVSKIIRGKLKSSAKKNVIGIILNEVDQLVDGEVKEV